MMFPLSRVLGAALCAAIFSFPGRAAANDSFDIALTSSTWSFAPDTTASEENGQLRITSTGTSAWAAPSGRWPASQDLALRFEGSAEGGRLIAQAEWFDRAGQLVAAEEIASLSGAERQTQGGPLTAPAGASNFGLKFWVEGDPGRALLTNIHLARAPDWPQAANVIHRVAPDNTKTEADSGLTIIPDTSSWIFVLAEGTSHAGVHLDSPVAARPGLRVLLPVIELPAGSSVSMQILQWGPGQTFLGEIEALKDVTEPGDYEFIVPESITASDSQPAGFTTKIWVNAPAGQTVRLGAPVYGETAVTP